MGSFSKMVIFLFCTIGFFALLFSLIPGEFFKASYTASIGVDKEIAEYFSVANVTMYSNLGSDNMTYPYSSWWDNGGEWAGGLPSGQYLEVWWASETPPIYTVIEFRHIEDWYGGVRMIDRCNFETKTRENIGPFIFKTHLVDNYDEEDNGTVFYARCEHLAVSTIIGFNQSAYPNIGEAWDGGELHYVLSYEIDWNASSVSAFTIMSQLLTFQNPDLGIEGDVGTIFNWMVAAPFWIMTAILILIVIQSLVPFIRGIDA